MTTAKNSSKPTLAGVIGYFEEPGNLIDAARQVRDARYQYFDAFTPYPVHGLDAAMGIRRSPIPFVTFIAGLTGGCLGFFLQYWISAVDWPLNVGGKPFNSWPAFIPVTFELTVLFAGLCTAGAMLAFNGLPNLRRKSFDPSLTNDKFALVIETPLVIDEEDERALRKAKNYKKFEEAEAADFLRKLGAKDVRTVYTEGWFGK